MGTVSELGRPAGRIVVDLYDGACGPTVRIDIRAMEDLLLVLGLVKALAKGQAERQQIVDNDHFVLTGLSGITMVVAKSQASPALRRSRREGKPVFEWAQDREGWSHCLGLIGAMVNFNKPCHQHLTTEDDDALVELAYLE